MLSSGYVANFAIPKPWNTYNLLSSEVIVIALFTCVCLKDQLGLCSINCHMYAMTVNYCASALQVVSAMTGN